MQRQFLSLLHQVADSALRDISALNFNKNDKSQLFAVCVYCTVVELAQGCLALIKTEQATSLPVLTRALIEAYVDLRAWRNDPDYYKNQLASFLKERLRLIDQPKEISTHPYLAKLLAAGDLEAQKYELQAELNQLRGRGRPALAIYEKFKKAGMLAEYQSLYWLMCLDGHHDLSSLEDRHLEFTGTDYRVVAFKSLAGMTYSGILDALVVTLIDSSALIHQHFNTPGADVYRSYAQAHSKVRGRNSA